MVELAEVTDFLVTFGVLALIGLIVYTKVKKQTFSDTFEDIKSLFASSADRAADVIPTPQPI